MPSKRGPYRARADARSGLAEPNQGAACAACCHRMTEGKSSSLIGRNANEQNGTRHARPICCCAIQPGRISCDASTALRHTKRSCSTSTSSMSTFVPRSSAQTAHEGSDKSATARLHESRLPRQAREAPPDRPALPAGARLTVLSRPSPPHGSGHGEPDAGGGSARPMDPGAGPRSPIPVMDPTRSAYRPRWSARPSSAAYL